MTGSFENRVVAITGASRGIGLATARHFAELGAHVVLIARSKETVHEEAAKLSARGQKALGLDCDVSKFRSVASTIDTVMSEFGRLDILVNNAGTIDPIARMDVADPEAWSLAIDTNVKGVFYFMRAALPVMREAKSGVIVNMSSGAANSALEGWSHYCSSKSAVKKLTECGHKEFGEHGIRVVGLSPGTVATDMMATIKTSEVNPVSQLDWSTHIPPEWAAKAVAYLCGDRGECHAGTDFSIKTPEGRAMVGLPADGAPDG